MLIILSDLHFGDGSCGQSISADAFYVFTERVKEMAMRASWREDGEYRPIDELNILLLGDILDPLHSSFWLDTELGDENYIRPWTERNAIYAEKLHEITREILQANAEALQILKNIRVEIPRDLENLQDWRDDEDKLDVPVRMVYMIGNHDWFYGIPGAPFDRIRAEVVEAFGLSQDISPFPYYPEDDAELEAMLAKYGVYAIHGDRYDSFNYDQSEETRVHAALGDIFTVEMLNRFPIEIKRQLTDIPPNVVEKFCQLSHVRPALATSLWVSSQIKHNNLPNKLQKKIKALWEKMGEEFLALDVVRDFDKRFEFDSVDKLEIALAISKQVPFQTINDLALWVQDKFWGGPISYAEKALDEAAFKEKKANYIVYGHTHHHEIVPLDTEESRRKDDDQIYFNAGTWHTYFALTIHEPYEQKFIPYQVTTCLFFYKEDERRGRKFETLSGTFS